MKKPAEKMKAEPTAKESAMDRKQEEISKFKGESRSYSNKRPIRKVLSRYAR